MAFTFLEGFQFFIRFFILIIRHPIIVGGETHYAVNFYAYETADFCDYIVSLQNWIFAFKYLESAIFCSLTDPCISPFKVRTILRVGIIGYGLTMIVILICVMATFPGYVNDNSTEYFYDWQYGPYRIIKNSLWLTLIFTSTIVIIFSIWKILETA